METHVKELRSSYVIHIGLNQAPCRDRNIYLKTPSKSFFTSIHSSRQDRVIPVMIGLFRFRCNCYAMIYQFHLL
jgi:hypothetical protein